MEQIAADDPKREVKPDEVDDFGFHYPTSYLSQVCWLLEASNFQVWPRTGGLDEQDANLIQDVMTWFRLQRRLRWEYEQGQWRPPEAPRQGFDPIASTH